MDHNIVLSGWNCRLRPVKISDSEFIVKVRNQDFAKGFIHATDMSIERQNEWTMQYLRRPNDYYWIVENISENRAVGTYGLYDIIGDLGMPGRMVLVPDSGIVLAALPILVREFAFEALNLKRLVGNVVPTNTNVIRLSKMMGGKRLEIPPPEYAYMEKEMKFDWYGITADMWPDNKAYWIRLLGERLSGQKGDAR